MELKFNEQGLTDRDLFDFEQALEVSLPIEFGKFYLKHNGGVPSATYFEGKKLKNFSP